MKSSVLLACTLGLFGATAALAQTHKLTEGPGLKANEDAREAAVLATCKTPPPPPPNFGGGNRNRRRPAPPKPPTHVSAIPDIIAAGRHWKTVWREEGNNADGIIGMDDGSVLVAQQDNSDVVKIAPNGHASVVYQDTNTGGALSMNKRGQLFDGERGLHEAIWELAPQHKVLAINYQGEPLDCLGGGMNDLSAAANGGVYFTMGKLYYASPDGVVSPEGNIRTFTNGIILSPDEKTLYVTDGNTLQSFDVQADGMLANQKTLATLKGFGDGSTVDAQGRIYVSDSATGVDVFTPDGTLVGSIPPPRGMDIISLAFGGRDKKTLFAAALYGDRRGTGHRGLPSDAGKGNLAQAGALISIPMIAQGYMGRAK
ncbi:MAG: SMP-30/gluconolactonase/LRE family protein [Steroidobacteraceae bacterium]